MLLRLTGFEEKRDNAFKVALHAMFSKAQIKYIQSLGHRKSRMQEQAFVAEGEKLAAEWLRNAAPVLMIVALEDWVAENTVLLSNHPEAALHIVPEHVLQAVSFLKTPNKVLIVSPIPAASPSLPDSGWVLALDEIQDPGNMGTIIRIADWFGIQHVVCSTDSADVYNPKVVQAAMGGHLRVKTHVADLEDFLKNARIPVVAATLEGGSVFEEKRLEAAILLIGNESKGIKQSLLQFASKHVTIPKNGGAESLNAAVSAGILCALLKPFQEAAQGGIYSDK